MKVKETCDNVWLSIKGMLYLQGKKVKKYIK